MLHLGCTRTSKPIHIPINSGINGLRFCEPPFNPESGFIGGAINVAGIQTQNCNFLSDKTSTSLQPHHTNSCPLFMTNFLGFRRLEIAPNVSHIIVFLRIASSAQLVSTVKLVGVIQKTKLAVVGLEMLPLLYLFPVKEQMTQWKAHQAKPRPPRRTDFDKDVGLPPDFCSIVLSLRIVCTFILSRLTWGLLLPKYPHCVLQHF